jgi:hypothetical protein
VLSGRAGTPGHGGEPGTSPAPAAAAARNLAAAWVAGQVNWTAVVACDPVMCRALAGRGVGENRLAPLGSGRVSPLGAQVIVVTPAVRARFGKFLGGGYAPVVLASFGSGQGRVDVRQVAPQGAAAFRAALSTDLASRKASAAELLRSSRITVTPAARRQLSGGRVDSRLLTVLAGLAAAHPVSIVDFGSVAPGGDPALPLRFADVAEHASAAAYLRSMTAFLTAQRAPYRPLRLATVRPPSGQPVLRILFGAPSPPGLLGPPKA